MLSAIVPRKEMVKNYFFARPNMVRSFFNVQKNTALYSTEIREAGVEVVDEAKKKIISYLNKQGNKDLKNDENILRLTKEVGQRLPLQAKRAFVNLPLAEEIIMAARILEAMENIERNEIVVIEGQGIGRELIPIALEVLKVIDKMFDLGLKFITEKECESLNVDEWEKRGGIPKEVFDLILKCGVALKGPTRTPTGKGTRRSYNVELRKELELFANPRLARYMGYGREGVDLVIVRENTEDLYSGLEGRVREVRLGDGQRSVVAISLRVITEEASKKIIRYAFELAKLNKEKTVIVADKQNILKETGRLFLEMAEEVAKEYPDITLEEKIIDNLGCEITSGNINKGIIVMTNMFGDIMSDVAAGLVGGEGVAPAANIGYECAIFETLAGTADKLVGTNKANPIGIIMVAAQLLEYIGRPDAAQKIYYAIEQVLKSGYRTEDLGGGVTTEVMKDRIIECISS